MRHRELKLEKILTPLLLLSGLSVFLMAVRSVATGTSDFWFLNWNLFLAWLPLILAWFFLRALQVYRLRSWQVILPLILWVIFLPNSFYLVTDFVHLEPYQNISLAFDIVMFMSYALTGLVLGMMSVFLIHRRLTGRFPKNYIHLSLAAIFWLCGVAVYYGRNLGWNSWDVVANPFSLILDTMQRIVYPLDHLETYTFSLLFFVFLSVVYTSFYYIVRIFRD